MIEDQVLDMLVARLGLHDRPKPQDNLLDLGADSLDLAEIIRECEETFGVALPGELTQEIKTVAQLFEHVSDRVQR